MPEPKNLDITHTTMVFRSLDIRLLRTVIPERVGTPKERPAMVQAFSLERGPDCGSGNANPGKPRRYMR